MRGFESQTSASFIKAGLKSQFSSVRANLSNGQYQRLVATIDGALGMTIGKGGMIEKALVDLSLKDGSMLVAGYDRSIDVPSGQLKSTLSGDKIALKNFALDLGSAGRLILMVFLMLAMPGQQDLKLNLNVPDMWRCFLHCGRWGGAEGRNGWS